jgi:hypothetical protein
MAKVPWRDGESFPWLICLNSEPFDFVGFVMYASNVDYLRLRALNWLVSGEYHEDIISGNIADWILAGKPFLTDDRTGILHSLRIPKGQRCARKYLRFFPSNTVLVSEITHNGYTDATEW